MLGLYLAGRKERSDVNFVGFNLTKISEKDCASIAS